MEEAKNSFESSGSNGDFSADLEDVINGKIINKQIGKWKIFNINSPFIIDFWYEDGNAIFSFNIITSAENIIFENYHRESVKGFGSPALQDFLMNMQKLAVKINKKIKIRFDTFGQEDTDKWLQKNGFTRSGNIYEKELL